MILRNDDGDNITIQPTVLDATGKLVGTMGKMSLEHWNAGNYNNQPNELVIIGSRRPAVYNPMLILLHITWRDEIAYRVNIGEIEEAAWVNVQREWKLIALG